MRLRNYGSAQCVGAGSRFFLFLTKNSFSYKYSFAKVLALMSLSFHHDLAAPEQESNSFMFTPNQVGNSLQSLQSGILGSRRKSVQVAFCHFQKAEQAVSLEVKKREEGGGEMEVVQKRKREKKEKVHISSSSSTFFYHVPQIALLPRARQSGKTVSY